MLSLSPQAEPAVQLRHLNPWWNSQRIQFYLVVTLFLRPPHDLAQVAGPQCFKYGVFSASLDLGFEDSPTKMVIYGYFIAKNTGRDVGHRILLIRMHNCNCHPSNTIGNPTVYMKVPSDPCRESS